MHIDLHNQNQCQSGDTKLLVDISTLNDEVLSDYPTTYHEAVDSSSGTFSKEHSDCETSGLHFILEEGLCHEEQYPRELDAADEYTYPLDYDHHAVGHYRQQIECHLAEFLITAYDTIRVSK